MLLVGVYLLVGCIPIPATQQYMMNGKLKPSYAIGKKADSPIQLGVTHIEAALAFMAERIAGKQAEGWGGFIFDLTPADVRRGVFVINDGRRYVMRYTRRSGYLVWPLCFAAWTMSETDYIALDVDAAGIVTDYHTAHDPAKLGITPEQIQAIREAEYHRPTTQATTTTSPSTRP
ncbi:MAG: hypothetical protein QM754_10640 [Tepidisphaeraceae bacterium]